MKNTQKLHYVIQKIHNAIQKLHNAKRKLHNAKIKLHYVILILVSLSSTIYAQKDEKETYVSISAALDIRNAIVGSDPSGNNAALDGLFQFAMVGQNIEVTVNYEHFQKIQFSKFSFGVGYHFPLYGRIGHKVIKTILIPSIEPVTLINRWGNGWSTNSHLSFGATNIALRWNLSDHLAVELLTNALPRVDLYARYPELHKGIPIVVSEYAKIIYKF